MTASSKRKGDVAEREAAALLNELLGVPSRRKLGAGRFDDCGDIDGVPDTVVQVCSRSKTGVSVAFIVKPAEAELQRQNAGATFAVTLVRIRGGTWRAVMTMEQWATLWREATA